jgi:hypothetical protein
LFRRAVIILFLPGDFFSFFSSSFTCKLTLFESEFHWLNFVKFG